MLHLQATYLLTAEGWLYPAAIKDLYTCEIVGRAFSDRMTDQGARRKGADAGGRGYTLNVGADLGGYALMNAYTFELLEGIFPLWEIDPSKSERLEMRTDLPFTLERSLEGGKGEQLLIVPPITPGSWICDLRSASSGDFAKEVLRYT